MKIFAFAVVILFVLGKAAYTYPSMRDDMTLAHFQPAQEVLEKSGYSVSDIEVFRKHDSCVEQVEKEEKGLLEEYGDAVNFLKIGAPYKEDGSRNTFAVMVTNKGKFMRGLHCYNRKNAKRSVFCKTAKSEE